MRLCFGTFAMVLNCCSQNIQQAALIARIARIVDPESRYIGENRYKDERIIGDGPATSKLLHCKIDFVFSGSEKINLVQDAVIEQVKSEVVPYINKDKKAKVILALLDIIRRDKYIDSENKENFKKYLGLDKENLLQQSRFVFPDFIGKVLLYTVCGGIDNKVGVTCVETITSNYIDDLARPYTYDFQWNEAIQELTLSFVEIFSVFNEAILDYQIDGFIEKVDPTVNMNYKWIEVCDNFLKYIEEHVWIPFAPNSEKMTGRMLKMTQQFCQTLDEYTKYLGCNMRPIAEIPETFVPLYREEKMKWALEFERKTKNYRQQVICIYQKIYHHAIMSAE